MAARSAENIGEVSWNTDRQSEWRPGIQSVHRWEGVTEYRGALWRLHEFEDFSTLISWWEKPGPGTKREENERAWRVPAAELLAHGAKEDITHLPPEQLAASILHKEQRIAEIMGNIQKLLAKGDASK